MVLVGMSRELDELQSAIQALEVDKGINKPNSAWVNFRVVTDVFLEIGSGIAVGLTIGYFIDSIVGTKFLFLLIFLHLGFISGIFNLYRKIKV